MEKVKIKLRNGLVVEGDKFDMKIIKNLKKYLETGLQLMQN